MAGHILELRGCTPEPLGNYLKGLGVFRLIAEQADSQARAWWKNGVLVLHTKWSRDELVSFFLHGIGEEESPIYSPSPIFAPWGGRSAFVENGGNAKAIDRRKRIQSDASDHARLRPSRRGIDETMKVLVQLGITTQKDRDQKKQQVFNQMRNNWSGSALDWFDAGVALANFAEYGFLFGTGGNEGSTNITNNFWYFIEEAIGLPNSESAPDSRNWFESAVFGEARHPPTEHSNKKGDASSAKGHKKDTTAGQHFPAAASSENFGQEFSGASATNPWDVVLMMEGCALFGGAATKRLSQLGKGRAAFPFMVDMMGIGGSTDSIIDESKQNQSAMQAKCQAEFWMPLWGKPFTLAELRSLLTEGRLQRPSGKQSENTLQTKEAIASLGTSRGVDTFHRVGLFRRRGDIYIAASLGYEPVRATHQACKALLAELEGFSESVYQKLRLKDREDRAKARNLPERIIRAREKYHRELAALIDSESNDFFSSGTAGVLAAAAQIEREVSTLPDREQLLTPCSALSRSNVSGTNPDLEYRLARSIAGITAWGEKSFDGGSGSAVESIRANLLPVVRRGKGWIWDSTSHSAVWSRGAPLEINLVAVLRRRLIDAQKGTGDGLPLWSSYGASFYDLRAFWHGNFDQERVTDLIHGLALVRSWNWESGPRRQERIDEWDTKKPERSQTPDINTSQMWFDEYDIPHGRFRLPAWLDPQEFDAACELPRVYHLLKLCFVGGRLPRRAVEGRTVARTGDEPFPARCLDVLTLLQAGRLADAALLAARRLRAKGYPPLLRDSDFQALKMGPDQCRRLAGMLLVPVWQPGVCTALAIKPETSC
jgi:CRISPR-associated protein Csx17